jgi:hypothetical protein
VQVSAGWLGVLRASAAAHGATWLHDLHVGVILTEMGGVSEPAALFNSSLSKRPSAVAARCLAVLQATAPAARVLYRVAWAQALQAAARGDISGALPGVRVLSDAGHLRARARA